MSKSEYYHAQDGEWVEVPMRNYREQCCDCGLVHKVNFRVNKKGKIEYQATRDTRATNGARRHFNYTKEEK